MAIASDSSVTAVLYAEVVFAFLWDVILLKTTPLPLQYVGAATIVAGSVSSSVLRYLRIREKQRLEEIYQASSMATAGEISKPIDSPLSGLITPILEPSNRSAGAAMV